MPKQPAFPGLRDAMKKKLTRRELFLAEMDRVVPWGRLQALIAPHYPKAGPTTSSTNRPLPMPSSTAWSTTPIALNSTATRCAGRPATPQTLTKAPAPDIKTLAYAATILR